MPCLGLPPRPFFRPGGGYPAAAGRALSRPRSAERSEGSLDRTSPPGRYTLSQPGRAGVPCRLGAPWGADGSAGPARSARKPRGVCGWSARTVTAHGRAGGRTREWAPTAAKRKPSPAEARGGRPTLRGALPSKAPWRGEGGDRKQWHGRSAAEPVPTAWPPGGRMGQSKAPERSGGVLRRPTGGKQMAPRAGRGSPQGGSPSTARTACSCRDGGATSAALPPVRCSASSAAPTGRRQSTPGGQTTGGNSERTDRDDDTAPA